MHNLRVSSAAPYRLGDTSCTETHQPQQQAEIGPTAPSQTEIEFRLVRGLIVAAGLAIPFWVGVVLLIRRLH